MFKQVLMTAGARVLNAILSVAMVVMSTRLMGAEAYGLVGLILLNVTVIAMVNDFFGGSSLVYFAPRVSLWRLLVPAYLWAVAVVLLGAAAGWLLSVFPSFYQVVVPRGFALHILLITLLVSWSGIHQNLLLGKEQVSAYNKVFSLQTTGQFVVLVVMLFVLGVRDARAWVAALYGGYGLSWIVGLWFTLKWVQPVPLTGWRHLLREILSFGAQGQMASSVHLANKRLSFYFITPILGPAALGIYNAGAQLTEGLRIVGQSISLVQFSHLSNSSDQEHNRVLTLLLLKFTVAVTLLAIVFLSVFPATIFASLLGPEFGYVRPVILSLATGVVALSATMIFSHYFSGTGRPKYNFHAALAGLAVTLVLVFPAVKGLGIVGAGLTASAAYLVSAGYLAIMFCRLTQTGYKEFFISRGDVRLFLKILVANRPEKKAKP